MQRMVGEEAQATMAFAATQRELQRMADEEAHAAMAVGHLQHETVHKAGLLGEQAREVYQVYQNECAAFAQLREESSAHQQEFHAGVQRRRGEFVEAEQVFWGHAQQGSRESASVAGTPCFGLAAKHHRGATCSV